MSSALSDYNKTKSSRLSRRNSYSDLDLNFRLHPNTSDIKPLTDLDAVKNSVTNLLLTNFGDRPFQPQVGTNITALLFEPADEFTAQSLKIEIKSSIERFEPRVNGVKVQVLNDEDRNRYAVTVGFNVLFSNNAEEINFYLERLR